MAVEDKYLYDSLVINGDMSADIDGSAVSVAGWNGFSIQSVYTGTPVGRLKVQISCDLTNNPLAVSNWDDIGDPKDVVGAGSHTFVVKYVKWKWARLVYVSTSGSGVLNANLNFRTTY
jgi:hypothetical protein